MPDKNRTIPGEVFADGVGWIGVQGGVVRMEFFSFDAPLQGAGSDKEPERTVRQRVIMPIDGFLRTFAAMSDLVKKLEDGGVVVRRPGPGAADAAGRAGDGSSPSSPNFG